MKYVVGYILSNGTSHVSETITDSIEAQTVRSRLSRRQRALGAVSVFVRLELDEKERKALLKLLKRFGAKPEQKRWIEDLLNGDDSYGLCRSGIGQECQAEVLKILGRYNERK